jgi:hypothetical protein
MDYKIESGSETGIELDEQYDRIRTLQQVNSIQAQQCKQMVKEYSIRINDSVQELIIAMQDFNCALKELLDE